MAYSTDLMALYIATDLANGEEVDPRELAFYLRREEGPILPIIRCYVGKLVLGKGYSELADYWRRETGPIILIVRHHTAEVLEKLEQGRRGPSQRYARFPDDPIGTDRLHKQMARRLYPHYHAIFLGASPDPNELSPDPKKTFAEVVAEINKEAIEAAPKTAAGDRARKAVAMFLRKRLGAGDRVGASTIKTWCKGLDS